jgi:hypothetical protein
VRTINYSSARCGAGKSVWADRQIASVPGRYVLAVDRRDVFQSRIGRINALAAEHGTHPAVVPLYSRSDTWADGVQDVRRRVREAGCRYGGHPHVVVVLTHEALKSSDLSTFRGWSLIIDEVPSIWDHASLRTPDSWRYLERLYNLIPVEDSGWSEVRAKADGPRSISRLYNDDLAAGLAVFHKRVRDRGVLVKLRAWEEAADGAPWPWFSLWSPSELAAFGTVSILGNAFEHSVTAKLLTSIFAAEVRLVPFEIGGGHETWTPRTVRLQHFAAAHQAGSHFLKDTPEGKEAQRRIALAVNGLADPADHYWSCNSFLYPDGGMVGEKVSPRAAGRNDLQRYSSGTFIYTAKPSDEEAATFAWFDISREEVIRAREQEDLLQMLWRSSLRAAADGRDVTFRVYDQAQAMFLRDALAQTGLPITVLVEQIDLALDSFERRKRGRPKGQQPTPAEMQARAERRRERDRLRKQASRAAARQADDEPEDGRKAA